ncbi:MAG: hypothetical protein M3458_04240 [Acidobacteriota bacterium]|nr:hypothetical protein [Acidobacteriota bacterium]
MSIMKNLDKVHAAVVVDKMKGGNLGEQIGVLAVKAITGGIRSAEWKTYMSLFADNAEQLKRLTAETPGSAGEEGWLPQTRAYIVSNAVCAAATNTFTSARVNSDVDGDLNETPDDTINLRPIVIPNVNVV